jgi:hypothetical protein
VQFGLLGRPSLERVDRQQAADKVDECHPVVEFCKAKMIR